MKDTGFIAEFKKFIARGNVLDMAVGIIIGGAFTTVVNSAVKDLIMPGIGLIVGGVDFSAMKVVLKAATETTEEVSIKYGAFINNVLTFLIVALCTFCLVKAFNKMKENEKKKAEAEKAAQAAKAAAAPPAPPKPSDEVLLLREIRDLLKK